MRIAWVDQRVATAAIPADFVRRTEEFGADAVVVWQRGSELDPPARLAVVAVHAGGPEHLFVCRGGESGDEGEKKNIVLSLEVTVALTMTTRQLHRREAMLGAVVALVAERGVDDLQMRDVADRSGVAMATLYRHFASKDHLVAVAFMTWAGMLEDRVETPSLDQAPPSVRLSQALRLGVRPFERDPQFAGMLLYVSTSRDRRASDVYLQLGLIIRSVLGRAIPDVAPDRREVVLQVIGSVWYHSIVEWVSGRISVDEVHERLERACQALLGAPATEVLQ